ncbi:PAS domain-containing sensor histidine kinase [Rhizobium sp. 16-488-2b]|uniref:sensor histidine kinase n=1 Tax=Rhizobium sp. 16-488-2b TaxID=2819991 RepID=UPI001ADACB71|nr:PAS domain-containing sensor histidine kinase [Rhizobium sp. 16-488-2b]MBO9122749.1 PAS domain S-box protein [Rhizobium sp. 16-488-2b]
MPAVQYPFIDIAVHPRVREHFARGEALVLFSADLARALWANGAGAELFGHAAVYDLLDQGVNRGDITYRQLEVTARQLSRTGDTRNFMIRIAQGFQRVAVQASVELIDVSGEAAVLVSLPVATRALSTEQSAAQMLKGLDDPDTHMAVIGGEGEIVAASPGFSSLGVTQPTAKALATMAGAHPHGLIKRPVATGKGYLPAAVGRISSEPALYLLFAVETVLGRLDPTDAPDLSTSPVNHTAVAPAATFADAIDAVAEIEDIEDAPDERIADDTDIAEASAVAAEAFEAETVPAGDEAFEAGVIEPDMAPVLNDETHGFGDVETLADSDPEPEALLATDDADDDIDDDEAPATAEEPVAAEDNEADEAFHPGETVADDDIAAFEPDDVSAEPVAAAELADGELASDDGVADEAPAQAPETHIADLDDEAEVAPAVAEIAPEAAQATTENGRFVFKPNSRATRFVWKIDAEGHFSEVSGEFAEAVGPHAADIIGIAFSDVSALFNLDPEGKISEALARRDTWSGKTIHWPIEGTSLAVPVDLAALPTYTRSREFDGFRGFGVVRLSDAAEDPLALGLTFGPDGIAYGDAALDQQDDETVADELAEETLAEDNIDEAPVSAETTDAANAATDDFLAEEEHAAEDDTPAPAPMQSVETPRAEPPVLRIVETPNRRLTDKIVQLHGVGPGLTNAEQANFREIAKRLEAFGVNTPDEDGSASAETKPAADEAQTATEEAPRTDLTDDKASLVDEVVAEDDGADEDSAELSGSDKAEQPVSSDTADSDAVLSDAEAPSASEHSADEPLDDTPVAANDDSDDVTEGLEETVSQMDILASFIPPRVKMTDGFSAGMIDQLPVAVLIHAGDQLIHANPEFMRLTGYRSLQDLADVGGIDALLQRDDIADASARHDGMMLVTMEDDLVPVSARLQSIRWEDSTALMLALMPVVSERPAPAPEVAPAIDGRAADRMVEKVAKLQVEVEELRSILETATDGVVVIGAEGDIRSMNRSASALFNYDEDDTRGKPFVMLFAHESQKAVLDYINGISSHGVASVLNDGREVIGREASGGFVPLFMTLGRLTSSSGYCAVIRDITQWKRTEDELRGAKSAAETANAHKTDFLARVSHEIRTPLNAIIGFSDMMAGERFGPIGHPRYVEYANDIGRSGRHVLDIVNDLLDISKIEAGEMDLDFDSINLNEAISEAVALLQPQANSQRVIIRTALSHAVPDVVADLRSIKQIALNILSNAIRFTPSGGQIVVSTSYETNGSVVLRIRDTGVGMTRSELDQAMKPFRQVSTQSRHRGEGTGLGLPLTKAMVDANRAIFAISSTPNEGTLVEIAFPSQRVLAS